MWTTRAYHLAQAFHQAHPAKGCVVAGVTPSLVVLSPWCPLNILKTNPMEIRLWLGLGPRNHDFTNQSQEVTSPGKKKYVRQPQRTTSTNWVLPTNKQWKQTSKKRHDGIEKSHQSSGIPMIGACSPPNSLDPENSHWLEESLPILYGLPHGPSRLRQSRQSLTASGLCALVGVGQNLIPVMMSW